MGLSHFYRISWLQKNFSTFPSAVFSEHPVYLLSQLKIASNQTLNLDLHIHYLQTTIFKLLQHDKGHGSVTCHRPTEFMTDRPTDRPTNCQPTFDRPTNQPTDRQKGLHLDQFAYSNRVTTFIFNFFFNQVLLNIYCFHCINPRHTHTQSYKNAM